MRVLLDTHAFLWWITDDPRLSHRARAIIADDENQLFLSVASAWEIAIKARLGRLEVPADLEGFIVAQLSRNRIEALPINLSHAPRIYTLPDHHRDPFDRLLVAQASVEGLPILTADPQLARYQVAIAW